MLYSDKDLKKLILPLVLEQLLAILVGMIDMVMVSGVGEAAVSGVSLVDNINILVINISAAMATGGAVVAGHFLGQKNPENAGKAAWQLILCSSVVAAVISFFLVIWHKPVLHLVFGQVDADVMRNAITYLTITAVAIIPITIYNSCAALFRAMNQTKITMWISIMMNVVNVIINAILIYGMKMGVAGAAIATAIARTLAAVIILYMMFDPNKVINIKGKIVWKIDTQLIKRILYIGIPNGLENSLFQLGKILLLSLISTFGTFAIAANAVCNILAGFNVLPGMAINLALLSVAAVCVGAGDYDQARYYTRKMLKLAIVCTAVISSVLILFTPWILKIYNLSPETEILATKVIRYHAIMAVFLWMPSFTIPNTLRAAGDVVWTMVIAIGSMWTFRIITSYLLSAYTDLGLMSVWIAMTLDWVFRAICYGYRYRGHKWEHYVISEK